MVTNLDAKINHRDDIRNGIDEVKDEVDKFINEKIDKGFNNFREKLEWKGNSDSELRKTRALSIEKLGGGKVKLKSYGESCELDFHKWTISYLRGGDPVPLEKLSRLPFLNENAWLDPVYMANLFW